MNNIDKNILAAIDLYCQEEDATQPRRTHLGASVIGQDCPRQTWYGFRWSKKEKFSGRMLRLFQRGHLEEPRFVKYLTGIGFQVKETDEDGSQFRISDVSGHFGGSCDGRAIVPDWLVPSVQEYLPSFQPDEEILLEFKTSGENAFKKLQKQGMASAKPQHKVQMDVYGLKMGLRVGLYMCVNKNTDELHIELIELDPISGEYAIKLAHGIISDAQGPMRKHPRNHFGCKYCNYKEICQNNAPMEINCRSCKNCHAVENAKFSCSKYNAIIPKGEIEKGCGQWEQVDNV